MRWDPSKKATSPKNSRDCSKPSKPGLGSLGPCRGPYTHIDSAQGDDGLRGRLAEAVLAKYYSAYTGKD